MKYGITIFPSKEIQDAANALRKRYDPAYSLVPPHIALKYSFPAEKALIDELIPELKKIANDTKPFKIKINKVSTFAPVTNTIYFKVEPNEQLTELNRKLHSGKFPTEEEHSFVPHITIAQKLVEQEYSDVYGTLRLKSVDFEDLIDRIHLCYKLDNGSWTVFETFVFGQEKI